MTRAATSATPADRIHEQVELHPNAPCLWHDDAWLTYQQVWDAASMMEPAFRASGLARGDKIAVLSHNAAAAVVAMVAILRLEGVWLPVNVRDAAQDIGAALRAVTCDALVAHPELTALATSVDTAVPSIRAVLELNPAAATLRPTPAQPNTRPESDANDLAAIFATGGTTGRPKGVAFSPKSLVALMDAYRSVVAEPEDVYLAVSPLTHGGGRICLSVMASGGATVVLPRFDARETLRAIAAHRVTTLSMTPTMLYRLLDEPTLPASDCSSLRSLVVGGAPLTVERQKQAIKAFGPILHCGYGQTEAPLFISRLRPEDYMRDGQLADDSRLRSVGQPTPVCRVRILDRYDQPSPPGEIGEIVVSGDFLMSGYYGDPQATAAVRIDGFQRTGDLGHLDEDGFLTIVGRKKDLIITGGFNVYPAEVEDAIAEQPGVGECAVFGLPDDDWGELVTAAIAPAPGAQLAVDQLRTALRERLGGVKAPKRIEIVDELPRNENGKVVKRHLVERFSTR